MQRKQHRKVSLDMLEYVDQNAGIERVRRELRGDGVERRGNGPNMGVLCERRLQTPGEILRRLHEDGFGDIVDVSR